jgi:hypothetical protein
MSKTHDELQAAIWNDERGLPPGTREVALAIGWVLHREPERRDELWKRVSQLLGRTSSGRWRIHEVIAEDAPRYEPGRWRYGGGACEGPRLRPYQPRRRPDTGRCWVSDHHPHLGECRYTVVHYAHLDGTTSPYPGPEHAVPERDNSVCGAHGTIEVTERDMVTGWETAHWFCSRHKDRAREVRAQLAARGEPPEPIPNAGGLLPRYFGGDWVKIYGLHCEKMLQVWVPPYYGVDADEWPVPGKTLIPKRPRLAVVS